jgi:hypothetical protein
VTDSSDTQNLKFDTPQLAFTHACAHQDCTIAVEQPLLAIVLDAHTEFGADEAITVEEDGCARVSLRVASKDGGFIVLSRTAKPPKKPLEVGDMVCWVPLKHDAELANEANDERFGWVGLVFATLEPEWTGGEWALREFYA